MQGGGIVEVRGKFTMPARFLHPAVTTHHVRSSMGPADRWEQDRGGVLPQLGRRRAVRRVSTRRSLPDAAFDALGAEPQGMWMRRRDVLPRGALRDPITCVLSHMRCPR